MFIFLQKNIDKIKNVSSWNVVDLMCQYSNAFTVTFDQFNVSLLNKSNNYLQTFKAVC